MPISGSTPLGAGPHDEPPLKTTVRRILIVEDNDDIREMIRMYLETFGHEVLDAADGPSGLAVALRERPELILMDLGLPGLDGLSLARSIRDADPRGEIRIVAMSGYGEDQLSERVPPGLIDRWLLKPVEPDVLLGVVRNA